MSLAIELLRRLDEPGITYDESMLRRCALSHELEEAGNYEAARDILGDLWRGVGLRPDVADLEQKTAAIVLLRAGSLSGWLGSQGQVVGGQESAKDLISQSISILESLEEISLTAEAQIELGWCYWREGSFDEARVILQEAANRLDETENEDLRVFAILRLAAVERAATRLNKALNLLTEIAPVVEASRSHALKGKFHNTLAHTLDALGDAENRRDYTDRALIESTAAGFHFEQAGHTPHAARVENNLGFLLFRAGRYSDTHKHLDRARNLFTRLKDASGVAQVDETRARTLLAQGRNSDAERISRGAVSALRKGCERALLAEALTTHGTALSRLGRVEQAEATFCEAADVAKQCGDPDGAARALLATMEELAESYSTRRLQTLYQRADKLLSNSHHAETLARLRAFASRLLCSQEAPVYQEGGKNFLYAAESTAELLRFTHSVATTERPILITGETGTGKEVLARLVHEWSGHSGRFVAINCATLSDTLLESQLFGHRKGSFTDAIEDARGAVSEAEGGTLFLDEIGELSRANQAKLIRLIEHGEVCRLGSPVTERIDVRIVAATNHDLESDVREGRFRADLFYRLEAFLIYIPPLRERTDDIPVIARHFIQTVGAQSGKRVTFSPKAVEAMKSLTLKGNARELRTLIERTFLTANDGAEITEHAVETLGRRQTQKAGLADVWANCSLDEEVLIYEGNLIRLALEAAGGRLTTAARLLGITHQGLSFIIKGRQKELLSARRPPRRRLSMARQVK
ncbi:MAG: sigma 54-interacting transcriptional regulator [Pyrinomonadaceae bacterium]